MSSNSIILASVIKKVLGGAFATDTRAGVDLSNNNYTATLNSYTLGATSKEVMVIGKSYYYEFTLLSWSASHAPCFGLVASTDKPGIESENSFYFYAGLSAIRKGLNTTVASASPSVAPTDTIGILVNMEGSTSTARWFKNGVAISAEVPLPRVNFVALCTAGNTNDTAVVTGNFGDKPYKYPVP